jgi:hypothetical protein
MIAMNVMMTIFADIGAVTPAQAHKTFVSIPETPTLVSNALSKVTVRKMKSVLLILHVEQLAPTMMIVVVGPV